MLSQELGRKETFSQREKELKEEFSQLEMETFEIEDFIDAEQDAMVDSFCSTCSTSSS